MIAFNISNSSYRGKKVSTACTSIDKANTRPKVDFARLVEFFPSHDMAKIYIRMFDALYVDFINAENVFLSIIKYL